jgi:3-oxoacid CoA-transferase subunit B
VNCVKKVITNLAVLDVLPDGGFQLVERAPDVSVDQIKKATSGKLVIPNREIPEMKL